jgi:hypothetical protein
MDLYTPDWYKLLDLRVHHVVTAQFYKYGTQQMMELLLARMNTIIKEHNQDILARMQADRKSDQQQMLAEIRANTKALQEDIKSGQAEMRSTIEAIEEPMNANQAEMISTVCAIRSDLKETIQHEIKTIIQPIWSELDETTACNKATETEPDPGTMQAVEEHQEIPKEEAAEMPVGGLRKRHRDRNFAAGCRQKPKGRIRASCECRKRSTVAGRRMTHRATVAWHRRNIFRKIGTQENCRPGKEFAAAGIRTIHCRGVAWLRRGVVREDCTSAKDERATQRVGPLRKNLRMHHEGKSEIKEPGTRWQMCPRIKKMLDEIFRGKITKQVVGTTNRLQKIRKWTLWRGRPPLKRKKRSCTE